MENLTLHIEYLLLRHDCVVVPGVGAFINVRHAARYDASTRSWLPPTREVRFNSLLVHDDGLLANSYARKHGVPFAEGRELLRRDIMQLTEALAVDGEVTVGQLGILARRESTLRFTPLSPAARLAARLGFTSAPIFRETAAVADNAAAATDVQPAEAATPVAAPTVTAEEARADRSTEAGSGRRFNTRRNYYIAVNKVFARISAVVMLVVAVTLSTMLPVSDCKREDRASVVPVERVIRTAGAVTTPNPEPEPEITAPAVAEPRQGRWHAVVATFTTQADAEKFISQCEASGYDLRIVNTRTRSRVSAISSDNRDSLQGIISSPDFQARFSQAWIWDAE